MFATFLNRGFRVFGAAAEHKFRHAAPAGVMSPQDSAPS
jgi:hypothetical protein